MPIYRPLKCPVCSFEVLDEYLRDHIYIEHDIETSYRWNPSDGLPDQVVSAAKEAMIQKRDAKSVEAGSKPSGKTNSTNSVKRRKSEPQKEIPLGFQVLEGLQKGEPWIASESESCDNCRKRIVFLEVERQKHKAFDVGKRREIVGVHICNRSGEAGSIYAFSGGAIDSNRRRH